MQSFEDWCPTVAARLPLEDSGMLEHLHGEMKVCRSGFEGNGIRFTLVATVDQIGLSSHAVWESRILATVLARIDLQKTPTLQPRIWISRI